MIGQRVGTFLLDELIGAGTGIQVYRATQARADGRSRAAAVKIATSLSDEIALKRFLRTAEILSQLRHGHIVRYYAHGKFRGMYYTAMEYIDGEAIAAVLERGGAIPWFEVVDLAVPLCRALLYLHGHQVVHRNLKPSHLMVDREGRLKLIGFGIAKDLDASAGLTRAGRTVGTAAYMAPEQIQEARPISHKTDLYGLGCVLSQMLTGRLPFAAGTAVEQMHAHLAVPPPRPGDAAPGIPTALDDLVVQLMAKDPADRPRDAEAVAEALEGIRERS